MGATMIESEIEKSLVMMKGYYFKKGKNELINELRGLMSLMREKKLEEGRSLNYFISEVLEIVHNARSQLENDSDDINEIVECLRQTKRLLQEEGWRSEEYGVWEGEVVGVEDDVKLLLHKIDMSQEMPWVGWIRGMVGSGKTTLAKLVYNHPDVVHKFELRVWVNCRKFISLKELVINIIQQVGGGEDYPQGKAAVEMDCADLITMLGERLSDKRFFLVLDHIGECQFWVDIIALYLRNHAKAEEGSILLVTSHTTNHLNVVGDYEHAMKALDPDKSWQLLLKKMLRIDDKFPKKAERKGKLVLMKHTGGLPFAIKEAAMEWAEKRSRGIEWEAIVDSDDLELKSTLEAIDLSFYYMLEPGVKFTFLHLGLFKLGEAISNQKFQQTFVASGVVESFPSNDLNNNYRHLEKIKIIQFKFKDILVNPIYHKLSITKAKKGNDGAHIGVIYCYRERFYGSTDQNEGQLICLSFKGGGYLDDSPTYWKCFEQLRVLDFEGFGLRFLPEMVGELMELRYLGLRNNYITELPCSLGNLKRLEVLDIAHNFMVKVPDVIWEMDTLLHLYMSDIVCMKPLKIEALNKLETITYISVDNWAYKVSGSRMMTDLYKLGIDEIDGNSDLSMLFASLAELVWLNCVVLRGFHFKSMPSLDRIGVLDHIEELKLIGRIPELPKFSFLLQRLTLINSCLDEDPMPILGEVSHLRYLKLRNSYTGQQMVISTYKFSSLETLCIEELWHLRNIQVGRNTVKLKGLKIKQCPYLQRLPEEMIDEYTRLKLVATKNIKIDLMKWNVLDDNEDVDIQPQIVEKPTMWIDY